MPQGATHICPIRAGAGGLISDEWCIDTYASKLQELPPDLSEAQISRPELLLWEEGPLSIYYAPFERVNPIAKVFLVGLTPGRRQMWSASMAAAGALRAGLAIPEVLDAAFLSGGFAGSMRRNLVSMLDAIGVARWLGLGSTTSIWTTDDAHIYGGTSALLHPVFQHGRNYGGGDLISRMSRVPILSAFVDQVLAASLDFSPDALVIPLGKAVSDALDRLVAVGRVDPKRVLVGLPHPSGLNGHRVSQFTERKAALSARVDQWAESTIG